MFSQTTADAANPAVRIGLRKVMQPVILCHELLVLSFFNVGQKQAQLKYAIPSLSIIGSAGHFILPAKPCPAASPKSCGRL
jgi:hypothetical protein